MKGSQRWKPRTPEPLENCQSFSSKGPQKKGEDMHWRLARHFGATALAEVSELKEEAFEAGISTSTPISFWDDQGQQELQSSNFSLLQFFPLLSLSLMTC